MSLNNLKKGDCIHLMGICGTAMASLAGILKEMGFKVTGSDQNVYPPMSTQLESLGIEIMEGYKAENLKHKPDLVVVGNVISKHFEEAEALLASDIPYTSLPKAIGEFVINDKNSIVVAGTHGKTTTSSMMTWLADCCGFAPGFLIGGIPHNYGRSFRAPEKDWFVIEGDEYDTAFFDKVPKFIHYRPKFVILTSIEFDHADIYDDIEQIKSAFKRLMELIPKDGLLIYNSDDPLVCEIAQLAQCKKKSYGLKAADYRAVDREILVGRNQFVVCKDEEKLADIAMKQYGEHNTLNGLGAFALAHELGWDLRKSLQSLADFKGVKRRQEIIGEPKGITVIEDFAHHPTAVRLTVQSIKEKYHGQKVFSIFEPRSATSRRNIFQEEYVEALSYSDVVILPKPFNQSKIQADDRLSTESLVADLKAKDCEAYDVDGVEEIIQHLVTHAQTGDVILIMSNGGFGGIYDKLLKELEA